MKRRDELDRQAACERGLLPPDSLKEGNTAWWATLDELPLSFDEAGNVSFVVGRFSASEGAFVNDIPVIPLDAQLLPQDWEQQVLACLLYTSSTFSVKKRDGVRSIRMTD